MIYRKKRGGRPKKGRGKKRLLLQKRLRTNSGINKLLTLKKWPQREKGQMKAAEMQRRERSHRLWHKGSVFYTKICLCFLTMYLLITRNIFLLWHIFFCRADAHLTRKTSNHSASRDKYQLIQHSSFKQNIAGSVSCALFVVPMFFSTDVFCNLHCTLQTGIGRETYLPVYDEASNSVARCCNIIDVLWYNRSRKLVCQLLGFFKFRLWNRISKVPTPWNTEELVVGFRRSQYSHTEE